MKILIIEDELHIAKSIKKIIEKNCLPSKVFIATNYEEAIEHLAISKFNIILIDVFLKGSEKNGLDICEMIKNKYTPIPIIIISHTNAIRHFKAAFELGVCDYIIKPFNKSELAIRIKRWQRLDIPIKNKERLHYKNISYDYSTNKFYIEEKELELTKKLKHLLIIFIRKPEELIKKTEIIEEYWGDFPDSNKNRNLRSTIRHLRLALKKGNLDCIKTVKGEGYILKIDSKNENTSNRRHQTVRKPLQEKTKQNFSRD